MSKEVRTYTKDGDKILVSHDPQKGVVGGICREPYIKNRFCAGCSCAKYSKHCLYEEYHTGEKVLIKKIKGIDG